MLNIWHQGISSPTAIVMLSVAVVLSVQLLLCFKVKSLAVRLIPALLLSALTSVLVIMIFFAHGWDGLGYAVLAIFTGIMLFMCGVGWGIWMTAIFLKRIRSKEL